MGNQWISFGSSWISTEVVEDSDNISNSQNTSPLDSTVRIYIHTHDIAKKYKDNTEIREKLSVND